jgi:methyl-accepting chemotaxis protein
MERLHFFVCSLLRCEIIIGLNNTLNAVNELISGISKTALQVAAESKQVASSSEAFSRGAVEQVASLQVISAAISEIAVQTKNNASNANEASQLTIHVKDRADQGNKHMDVMLKAMKEINEAAAQIFTITEVINDFASQTNLLALNATIEAARAGEQGKGFAVIAEEVQHLAVRSTKAQKEIAEMIKDSITKTEVGAKVAKEMASSLNTIVENVSKARNIVADIAVASNQQASAIAQLNRGIEQVSRVTQTNTVTANESTAVSQELSNQAELLKIMVGKFQINDGDPNEFQFLDIENAG